MTTGPDRDRLALDLALRAEGVLDRLLEDSEQLSALPDMPGQAVHALFARLYYYVTRRWLDLLRTLPEPELAYLSVLRFYEIYRDVDLPIRGPAKGGMMPHWQRYLDLGERLTLRSSVTELALLLSLGARAHPRFDLALTIWHAHSDFETLFGVPPDMGHIDEGLAGRATSEVFFDAVFDFSHGQSRIHLRPWPLFVLRVHRVLLSALRFVWVPILQRWRLAAWRDACHWIEAGINPYELPRYRPARERLCPPGNVSREGIPTA